MGKLRFSLLQLVVSIAIILFIAYTVINNYQPQTTRANDPFQPQVTIPFQNIKLK